MERHRPWQFLTHHGRALLCIARTPDARARDIAEEVGVTERSAQRLIADLVGSGYVERTRVGRRNQYRVNRTAKVAHPRGDKELGAVLDAFLES